MFYKGIVVFILFLHHVITTQKTIQSQKDNKYCLCVNLDHVCCPDICVIYFQCNTINFTVITDGEGMLDIRSLTGNFHASSENYTLHSDEKSETLLPKPIKNSDCGRYNPDGINVGNKTTSNNNTARFGEFPWMVALTRITKMEGHSEPLEIYQCGGALIHPQVVVTTAYCVQANEKYKIIAGEWDSETKIEPYPHQDIEVDTKAIHPEYNSRSLHNDIALLFLKKPVEITPHVNVICLPPQGSVIDNGRCYASGWGKDGFGYRSRFSEILKKIDLPIVPNTSCQDALRKVRLGEAFVLHESFICAGGEEGKDTCKGDGGSPLVCPIPGEKGRYQQVGIVSWGIECGRSDVPGVYTNLARFTNWIHQQMKLKNLNM